MDAIFNLINDFFRQFLFELAQCFLFIFDIVWECVKRVITIDISAYLAPWFILISSFLILFLIFRIAKIFIKNMFDDEYRARFNVVQFIIKIMIVSFAVGFVPIGFSYISKSTSDFITNIDLFIPSESEDSNFELKPSSILLQVGRIDTSNITGDLSPEIEISSENFEINKKDENDKYIYFPNYTSLFLLIIESITGCIIFVMIAIMIAARMFMIAYKYILAPYPISGLIDDEDKSFSTWLKMILGDFMMNFAQVYCVYLTLFLCNNASIQNMLGNDAISICGKIMFFLGGLIAILNLPSIVATIIGGNSAGFLQSLQEVKSIMTMTSTLTSGIAGASAGVAMGAAGGLMTGISNGYTNSVGNSFISNVAGGIKNGISQGAKAGASTLKTNFTGQKLGGGISKGASILKDGFTSAKSNFSNSDKNNNGYENRENPVRDNTSSLNEKKPDTTLNNNINEPRDSMPSNKKNHSNIPASEFFANQRSNQSSFNKNGEKIYNDTLNKRR